MPILRNSLLRQSLKHSASNSRKGCDDLLNEDSKPLSDLSPNLNRLLFGHKVTRGAFDVVTEYMHKVCGSISDPIEMKATMSNSKRSFGPKSKRKTKESGDNGVLKLNSAVDIKLDDMDDKENKNQENSSEHNDSIKVQNYSSRSTVTSLNNEFEDILPVKAVRSKKSTFLVIESAIPAQRLMRSKLFDKDELLTNLMKSTTTPCNPIPCNDAISIQSKVEISSSISTNTDSIASTPATILTTSTDITATTTTTTITTDCIKDGKNNTSHTNLLNAHHLIDKLAVVGSNITQNKGQITSSVLSSISPHLQLFAHENVSHQPTGIRNSKRRRLLDGTDDLHAKRRSFRKASIDPIIQPTSPPTPLSNCTPSRHPFLHYWETETDGYVDKDWCIRRNAYVTLRLAIQDNMTSAVRDGYSSMTSTANDDKLAKRRNVGTRRSYTAHGDDVASELELQERIIDELEPSLLGYRWNAVDEVADLMQFDGRHMSVSAMKQCCSEIGQVGGETMILWS